MDLLRKGRGDYHHCAVPHYSRFTRLDSVHTLFNNCRRRLQHPAKLTNSSRRFTFTFQKSAVDLTEDADRIQRVIWDPPELLPLRAVRFLPDQPVHA